MNNNMNYSYVKRSQNRRHPNYRSLERRNARYRNRPPRTSMLNDIIIPFIIMLGAAVLPLCAAILISVYYYTYFDMIRFLIINLIGLGITIPIGCWVTHMITEELFEDF